jgi:hypothetical protein
MKKIYSVALILLSMWAPSLKAQLVQCTGATAIPIVGVTSCRVIVFGMPANAVILVFNAVGDPIGTLPPPTTDAFGNGSVFYNCNSSPARVVGITATGTCFANVTAPIFLPIKVKNFTAHAQSDNSVLLRWASSFESNSYQYVIQKSADGRNFSDIGELKAAGNSLQTINYSFSDRSMANGGAYYRLKLVDLDGSFDYTKIIYINNGQAGLLPLSVFPNPFRSEVQLKGVTASEVNRKNVKIYNSMGSEVSYRVIGGNSIIVDPSLPKGVYILRVKGQAFKLFKE